MKKNLILVIIAIIVTYLIANNTSDATSDGPSFLFWVILLVCLGLLVAVMIGAYHTIKKKAPITKKSDSKEETKKEESKKMKVKVMEHGLQLKMASYLLLSSF